MAKEDDKRERLGEILVEAGLVTMEQLHTALEAAEHSGARLGETLVALGALTQDQINWALAKHFGLSYVDVHHQTLDRELVRSLRPGLLYQHEVIPLVRIGDTVTLAMADPTDSEAVLEVTDTTGCHVERAIASATAILAALDTIYSPKERRQALADEPAANDFATMAAHPVPRQRLGEILVDSLLITDEQLQAALARQKGTSKRLGETLIDEGILTEDQINWALARHLDVPYIDLRPDMVDPELLSTFAPDFLRSHGLVPMMRVATHVCVAMVDPLDREAITEVAATTGCDVVVSIASRASLEAVLRALPKGRHQRESMALPADVAALGLSEAEAARMAEESSYALSPEGTVAFKETIQQSPIPLEDKIRVYEALRAIARARRQGGVEAERQARRKAFATLTPAAMKLGLQLSHQVGMRRVPVLKDEEFQPKLGAVGRFIDGDRRFIVDRRAYERAIREHARRQSLNSIQIENAVMAARAYVATGGTKQILLISEGEKELAAALTKVIRLAHTRENPHPDTTRQDESDAPERRTTDADTQARMDQALADSGLDDASRDKAIRAFRVIHQHLRGAFDRGKLKALIRTGLFAGFSKTEIALVERILRIHGYKLS